MKTAIDLLKGRTNALLLEDGGMYTKVQDRIEVFREVWGDTLGINTTILTKPPYNKGDIFIMRAEIYKSDVVLAAGHAMEIIASNDYTKTSFVETAETSAIGRALASFGLHGGEYASAEEIENVPKKQKAYEEHNSILRKIFLDNYNDPMTEGEAEKIKNLLIGSGSMATSIGELSEFWVNNGKAIDLLKKSDDDRHKQVIDYFKDKQATLEGEKK